MQIKKQEHVNIVEEKLSVKIRSIRHNIKIINNTKMKCNYKATIGD